VVGIALGDAEGAETADAQVAVIQSASVRRHGGGGGTAAANKLLFHEFNPGVIVGCDGCAVSVSRGNAGIGHSFTP
jgi:hypothetical protein